MYVRTVRVRTCNAERERVKRYALREREGGDGVWKMMKKWKKAHLAQTAYT